MKRWRSVCWGLDLASLQRSNKGPFWSESQQTECLEKVFITFNHFLYLLKFRFGAPRMEADQSLKRKKISSYFKRSCGVVDPSTFSGSR